MSLSIKFGQVKFQYLSFSQVRICYLYFQSYNTLTFSIFQVFLKNLTCFYHLFNYLSIFPPLFSLYTNTLFIILTCSCLFLHISQDTPPVSFLLAPKQISTYFPPLQLFVPYFLANHGAEHKNIRLVRNSTTQTDTHHHGSLLFATHHHTATRHLLLSECGWVAEQSHLNIHWLFFFAFFKLFSQVYGFFLIFLYNFRSFLYFF